MYILHESLAGDQKNMLSKLFGKQIFQVCSSMEFVPDRNTWPGKKTLFYFIDSWIVQNKQN